MRAFLLHSGEPAVEPLLEQLTIPHGTKLPPGNPKEWLLIHWGAFHPDRGQEGVLQPVKSILLAGSKQRCRELLQLHGIEPAGEEPPGKERTAGRSRSKAVPETGWSHEFLVPVFHLRALTLFHKAHPVVYGGKAPLGLQTPPKDASEEWKEIGLEQPNYHAFRAAREAVKAVYALGLDYGVVRIGVKPGGQLAVLELQAVPELTPRLADLFAGAMERFDEELQSEEKRRAEGKREVMLGADPEFLLRNAKGKVAFASRFVGKDGPFGCDAIVLASRRKIYPLAELRPRPSTDVRELVMNLHKTMQLAARRIPDPELQWIAGGMPVRGLPLGGHIHFSGVELNCTLLRVLDNYVALPMTLLEDATTARRKPAYGFLGDFRRQRHGGFEYRVLPSWLVSPTVTKGVLALAKLTAQHYRELKLRPLADPEVQKAYYRGDKQRIRPLMASLWRDLERLEGYAALEAYLLPLRKLMLQLRSWDEQQDFRTKWKISPSR